MAPRTSGWARISPPLTSRQLRSRPLFPPTPKRPCVLLGLLVVLEVMALPGVAPQQELLGDNEATFPHSSLCPMMEVGAHCMSASQGCTGNMDVVQTFTEALAGRIGADRFDMWFVQNVTFQFVPAADAAVAADAQTSPHGDPQQGQRDAKLLVLVRGQFALDRLQKNFLSQLRGAAMQVLGSTARVELRLQQPRVLQTELPLDASQPDQAETDHLESARRALQVEAAAAELSSTSTPARGHGRSKNPAPETVYKSGVVGRGKTRPLSSLVSGAGLRCEVAGKQRRKNAGPRRHSPITTLPGQMQLPGVDAVDTTGNAGDPRKVASTATAATMATRRDPSTQPQRDDKAERGGQAMTLRSFVESPSSKLAFTAAKMVCETPGVASPLFLCGPTGTGKTHLVCAVADMLRRRHRMRRVVHLSAEQFTNDFIASVGSSGITAFRSRYRDIDALLIDDVQFLATKKATLRELLYTMETLAAGGRPMVFSGLQSPTEIAGLTSEVAGRMAAGLVCQIGPLDQTARHAVLQRLIQQRCPIAISDDLVDQLASMVAGDGRVISGLVNSVTLLARMHGVAPTIDQVRTLAGDLLRSARPIATLTAIEVAVCEAFQLPLETLKGKSQTRSTTEPRMLAMYLARQMTSSAYAEIARHFGGKSHSTAIAAEKNVHNWLDEGKTLGRGHAAMSTRQALDRVESLIRVQAG